MNEPHHYIECGLDYVYILNGFTVHETGYGPAVEVDGADALDRQIALAIVNHQGALTGQEVRFLRGLLDLTQAELGFLLGKDAQSVARWERLKTAIPPTEDRALRQIYLEETGHPRKFVETSRLVAAIESRIERVTFRELAHGVWERQAA
ncbi:MAG: transcriptional regulator [Alphaproteobacteria bacterium]|nr:transcriptional regulator [Alphaproteobacteria bacterium]